MANIDAADPQALLREAQALQAIPDLELLFICASGDGDIVARGAADSDGRSARRLVIGDAASWREGHGVRIEHAGPSLRLDVATHVSGDASAAESLLEDSPLASS